MMTNADLAAALRRIAPETTVATMFRHRSQMQQHMRIFCENAYACCELYRALMTKYEDEEGDR